MPHPMTNLKISTRIIAFTICIIMLSSAVCTSLLSVIAYDVIPNENKGSSSATQDNEEQNVLDSSQRVDDTVLYANTELIRLAEQYTVVHKMIYEDWNPYDSSMTIDEYYEVIELFQLGILPLTMAVDATQNTISGTLSADVNSIQENPSTDDVPTDTPPTNTTLVPRTMFLFNGLNKNISGANAPLPYPPSNDETDELLVYPEGLDPNGLGYMRPPMSWTGIPVSPDDKSQLVVSIVQKNENDDDPTIAGNVVQSLFPEYDGYYVSAVYAESVEVAILGVIEKNTGEYVYFYMSADDQNTQVSSTTLPDGEKFVVQYSPREFAIDYKILLDSNDVTIDWVNNIFGANRLSGTVGRKFAFDATGPYFYETEFWFYPDDASAPVLLTGASTTYPLGREITYVGTGSMSIVPNTSIGPSSVVWHDTFNLPDMSGPGTIIAQLTPKSIPNFDAGTIIRLSTGSGGDGGGARGTNGVPVVTVKDRATGNIVTVPYDYEDESLYRLGLESKYIDYPANGNWPNIMNYESGWRWGDNAASRSDMRQDADGTYSFVWTFQTNSGEGGYTLDSFAVNNITVQAPYANKYDFSNKTYVETNPNTYYSETALPDGAIVRVEFLSVFSGGNQRVYRVVVTGAQSDVVITAINLMTGTGSVEFVVNGQDGVHADREPGGDQNQAVEYYSKKTNTWEYAVGGAPVIDSIDYSGTNTDYSGANIRFKLKEGFNSPYYYFSGSGGSIIGDNTSVLLDENGNIVSQNGVLTWPAGDKLQAGFIYGPDKDGWYYIRLTGQESYRFANLTVGAREVKYVIQYISNEIPEYSYEDSTGATVIIPPHMPVNMPTFLHSASNGCHPSFWDVTNGIWGEQYDDFDGVYYDATNHYEFIVSSTIPSDTYGYYKFIGWTVLDRNGNTIDDLLFLNNQTVDINTIKEYSVVENKLGGDVIDVSAIKLMPVWKSLRHPFKYSVVLDWIDAQGVMHQEHFSDYWQDILTESPEGDNSLTVFVNTSAGPLLDWIAQHPTYTFWDGINNIVDDNDAPAKIQAELDKTIPSLQEQGDMDAYQTVLNALLNQTDNGARAESFSRLGGYAFQVHENGGRIVIWMYENKGGLMFHEDVQQEGFITDEEFYFTIDHVQVGNGTSPLNNIYKAYPEHVYNNDGTERPVKDSDAWLVKFEDGKIVNITKNGNEFPEKPVTYFTLMHGEGIMLYVPDGNYTITQLGSKSGGKYKVAVEYDGDIADDDQDGWEIPNDNDLWVRGSLNTRADILNEDTIMQVSAKVQFDVGEANVVHTIIFHDKTSSLSIQKNVVTVHNQTLCDTLFTFNVWLSLPEGDTPLYDAEKDIYYYVIHKYDSDNKYQSYDDEIIYLLPSNDNVMLSGNNIWKGTLYIQGGWHTTIVMQVLQDDINYYVEEDVPSNSVYKLYNKDNELGTIVSGELQRTTFWNTDFEPGLTITETIVGPTSMADNTVFSFEVELRDNMNTLLDGEISNKVIYFYPDGTSKEDTILFVNGKASVQLKNGEMVTIKSLSSDTYYSITQSVAVASDGRVYRSWSENESGILPKEDTTIIVNFENTLPVPLTITKTVMGTAAEFNKPFVFTLTLTEGKYSLPSIEDLITNLDGVSVEETNGGYILTFALKHNDSITFDTIPYLTEYLITEDNGDYIPKIISSIMGTQQSNSLHDILSDTVFLRYENQRDNGALTIAKQVQDPQNQPAIGTGDKYTFTIILTPPSDTLLSESDCVFTLYTNRTPQAFSGHTWTDNGDGTITVTISLMHGQSLAIEELPPNTTYTIEEVESGDYKPSYSAQNGLIQPNSTTDVTVVNTPQIIDVVYDLTISKIVTGELSHYTDIFCFTIHLVDKDGNVLNGDYVFNGNIDSQSNDNNSSLDFVDHLIHIVDGVATVMLSHEQNITIKDLPANTQYTVTENDAVLYKTTISVVTDGISTTPITSKRVSGQLNDNTRLDYTNFISYRIPTDATLIISWAIICLCMSCLGILWIGIKRRNME